MNNFPKCLTKDQAYRVYDLLMKYGASKNPDSRETFMYYFTEEIPRSSHEWRFCGMFGFGGKIRLQSHRGLSVDFYSEDETPERLNKLSELKKELEALQTELFSNPIA